MNSYVRYVLPFTCAVNVPEVIDQFKSRHFHAL